MPSTLTPEERAALERLITVAQGDSGQRGRVANFLLAWWNASECGGLDLTDMWHLDTQLQRDVVTVFGFIVRAQTYPDTLGYKAEFQAIIEQWRSGLLQPSSTV